MRYLHTDGKAIFCTYKHFQETAKRDISKMTTRYQKKKSEKTVNRGRP